MARFFIDRPVFAWVISILIMGIGALSIISLPVAQYPQIAPPTVSVNASYPGASAQTVANTVTQVLEQQMTGLDGLRYFSSTSSSAGSASITLTFETGTDPDIAQVQVQNKVSQATALLPDSVQRQGVTVQKSSSGFLMVVALISPDGTMNQTDLADYLDTNLTDQISRIDGVGDVQVFGSPYAMRIWLDPSKLSAFGLSAADVVNKMKAADLTRIFGLLGEERHAGRIARAIEAERKETPFETTKQLVSVIEKVSPRRAQDKIHPATRVFQALRTYVNDELGELAHALFAAEQALKPGGRLVIVSFHSLEDRIVKRFFQERSGKASGSRHLPQVNVTAATFEAIGKQPVSASEAESEINPRARSAKLRAGERTEAPAGSADMSILPVPQPAASAASGG